MSFITCGAISFETSEKSLMVRWKSLSPCYLHACFGLRSDTFTYKNKSWRLQLSKFSSHSSFGRCSDLKLHILDANNQDNIAAFRDRCGSLMFEARMDFNNYSVNHEEIDDSVVFRNTYYYNHSKAHIFVEFFEDEKGSKTESSLLTGDRFIRLYGSLKEAYLNKLYSDFTIVVKEREFEVHKMILAARSTVFSAMMKSDMEESRNNRLTITDCNPDAFHIFLLYLYSESTEDVSTENVTDVYIVADKYGALELKAYCIEYMKSNISVDRFCDVFELAAKYDESELLKALKECFIKKPREIVTTVDFQSLMKENTKLATELFLLTIPTYFHRKRI